MKRITLGVVIGVAIATPIHAQNFDPDDAADRVDSRLDDFEESDDSFGEDPPDEIMLASTMPVPNGDEAIILASGRRSERKPEFSLNLSLPFKYNTNVENAETNPLSTFHTNPSLALSWKKNKKDGLVPFALAVADIDANTKHSNNDVSLFLGRVGVRYIAKGNSPIVPYAQYQPIVIYGGVFDNHIVTLHNFVVGIGKVKKTKNLKIAFDLNAMRREATSANSERSQLSASLKLKGPISGRKNMSWALGQHVQFRNYTSGANIGREDVNLRTTAGIQFKLSKALGASAGLKFERNISNVAGKDFSKWDLGPELSVGVAF